MKAHPSYSQFPCRTGASPRWRQRSDTRCCMQPFVLGTLDVAVSSSPQYSASCFLAHLIQWFTWLPSILYFYTFQVLLFAALERTSSTFGGFLFSLPHSQTPALVRWADRVPVSSSSQSVSSHCDESGLALGPNTKCCSWTLVISFAFNPSRFLSA